MQLLVEATAQKTYFEHNFVDRFFTCLYISLFLKRTRCNLGRKIQMERRHIFRQYCRRTFSSDMARFPASSLLPNVSRTRDDEIANLRACNRITQPIDMMREWKRSDKAVNSNYNSACSNQPAPDVPSSRSDKAPDQAVIRLESSRWSDSEERTNDVMNCRNIDTAFGHVAEKILRGFPQWYPRNSANSFLEVLKRLPFDMNLPMVASTSADSQSVTACSRTPPDRLVALNNPDQLQLSDRSDSRCGRLCDINEIVCSTSRSFDNLSSMLQDCGISDASMKAEEVRQKFIKFFADKYAHTYYHSSPVIPYDDPTLLFANAGMNQFKPIFLGSVNPNSQLASLKRAVNTQKCIRAGGKHNDLDDVGKDVYHHTFFEMLGNWSFGDYFKEEICAWAWELLTDGFMIEKDRLYVTYFGGNPSLDLKPDLECRDVWRRLGIADDRILPFGMKDNFWEMGEVGPCGPCSEIHYDRVGGRNAAHLVNKDDPNVLELWNLVFITYNREGNGVLRPLPKRHIDCGLGFERLVSVIQRVPSNYDTDLFLPIFDHIASATGCRPYSGKVGTEDVDQVDMAYRVVADHIRALTVALSDGGRPDSTGRGYVLRRILRRGVRFAIEKLKASPGFFASLVPQVVDILGTTFPELNKDPATVMAIIDEEERQFLKTLSRGGKLLGHTIDKIGTGGIIQGDIAWRLYDTYGFPVDLTELMAEERGCTVDMAAYEACRLAAQKASQMKLSYANSLDFSASVLKELSDLGVPETDDSLKYRYKVVDAAEGCYALEVCSCQVLAIRANDKFVDRVTSGDSCVLVCDRTSFYAENGGQIYDEGFMEKGNGQVEAEFLVCNVQLRGGYVLHYGKVEGVICVGDKLTQRVDEERRNLIMKNHTATHLLNYALRQVLEESVQKGSLVAPDRLRFDFSSSSGLTNDQLKSVEQIVLKLVAENQQVYVSEVSLALVKTLPGLRAQFQEAYPDPVRVVSVGHSVDRLLASPSLSIETSVELCGGTHLYEVGHINDFVIISEEALARGIRRIVALTGPAAKRARQLNAHLNDKLATVQHRLSDQNVVQNSYYKAKKGEIVALIEELSSCQISCWQRGMLNERLQAFKRQIEAANKASQTLLASKVLEEAKKLSESNKDIVVHAFVPNASAKILDSALKNIKSAKAAIVFSVDEENGKVLCMACVRKQCTEQGLLSAKDWTSHLCCMFGGKGGGRDVNSQAVFDDPSRLTDIVKAAEEFAKLRIVT
uniref:Alanine--tRNA ligase n=1 Tax=Trichuris muris TaxID=70415 RepID=A0A5S6QDE3_TRIMR